ncbi:MAG: phage tail tube protein [Lachnospiraceae bacterium]|nr:phage tail tube protein [Lachnospiraceae bacterium]
MADRTRPSAGKIINGTFGKVYFDGYLAYEISNFETSLDADREEVLFAGDVVKDSKLMSVSLSWSATIRKVYSRTKDIVESLQKGEDVRVAITTYVNDPDNGGTEAVSYPDCWFDSVTIQNIENGAVMNDDLSGGMTSVKYTSSISDPCR